MTRLRVIDRLTGRKTQIPNETLIAGRYAFLEGEPPFANGLLLEPGDLLLPSPGDKLSIEPADGDLQLIEETPFQQFPGRMERQSLIAIGERLKHLENRGAGWREWVDVSPLVVGNLDRTHLTPFERALQKFGWHLAQVCVRPLTQLAVEIERLPVGRARRIPARAYAHLASHTEDWDYPKLTTVVPRKILSTLPQDLLDFYENRLATRLARETYVYLAHRRAEVSELEKWKGELEFGTYRRQIRVYSLLAEAISEDELTRSAEHTRRVLDSLYEQTLTLFDSPLYRAVPASSRESIPTTMRATNILVNDRHYRYINLLWREYLERSKKRSRSSIDVQRELQDLSHAFERYAMLMVCRALYQLGYAPLEEVPIKTGAQIRLNGPWGNIELRWENSGVISLVDTERVRMRIVPLISALTSSVNETLIADQVRELYSPFIEKAELAKNARKRKSVEECSLPRSVVIYPGSAVERRQLQPVLQHWVCSSGVDMPISTSLALIPIRTYELGSLERVARSIRWALLGDFILGYPPNIAIPTKYHSQLTGVANWLKVTSSNDEVNLLRPALEREAQQLQELVRDLRGELVRQGQKANQLDINRLENFMNDLQEGEDKLRRLRICPVCGQELRIENFHQLDNDCFQCECAERDCGAVWGLRFCLNCNQHYPYLGFSNLPSLGTNVDPEWTDHLFGMDILATPCPSSSGVQTYICPFCGECGRQLGGDQICVSCQAYRNPLPFLVELENTA